MPDYKAMYNVLFNGVTNAILVMQKAQQDAENICIDTFDVDPDPENEYECLYKDDNTAASAAPEPARAD